MEAVPAYNTRLTIEGDPPHKDTVALSGEVSLPKQSVQRNLTIDRQDEYCGGADTSEQTHRSARRGAPKSTEVAED